MSNCFRCKKHKGTIQWVGEEGFLAISHGFYKNCCECCATEMQLEYAEKLAANIPSLRVKLTGDKEKCK